MMTALPLDADFTVITIGADSSGRPIRMTRYQFEWWLETCRQAQIQPTITQGAFMYGRGAPKSGTTHSKAGVLDTRVRDLDHSEIIRFIRTCRARGAAAWLRDEEHGGFSDRHVHLVLGSDYPLSDSAAQQWRDYQTGLNGLASRGPDYHWRPDPLQLIPPGTGRWDQIWVLANGIQADTNKTDAARLAARTVRRISQIYSVEH